MFSPCLFLCLLPCNISVFCHFSTFICLSPSLLPLFISISRRVGVEGDGGGGHLRRHQLQNKHAWICRKFLLIAVKGFQHRKLWAEKNSGAAVWSTDADYASEGRHQKTSDPRGRISLAGFLSEVQMIRLLGGKVRDWFYVRDSKYENISYPRPKIFDVSSHEPLVKAYRRMEAVEEQTETGEGKFKISQKLLVNEIMAFFF